MAYNVSNNWITKSYSGESLYSCRLLIENKLVPIDKIEKIDISSPIVDNSSQDKPFYIGTFISQSITIKFKNLKGLNIKSLNRVDLYIGQIVDDENTYEEIPIGRFLIDDLAENYQETCEITCLDYGILFSTNCDYSSALGEDGTIEVDDLYEWICNYYGIEFEEYPHTNGTVKVGSYDNTLSGKYYISCIAEIKGCNAKMTREGKIALVPIKSSPTRTINALKSKSWKLGEKYVIKTVAYFDAVRNFTFGPNSLNLNYEDNPLYYQGVRLKFLSPSDRGNTLFIRQDNPFIVDDSVVSNIYDIVKDLEIWSLKCENYGDLSIDAWDTITYTLGEESYNTFYNNTTTYEMTVMSTNEVQIPSKQQEITTNVVGGTQDQRIKKVSTEVNNINGTITLMAQDIDTNYKEFTDFKVESGGIVARVSKAEEDIKNNKEDAQGQIDDINRTLEDGVSSVKTTSVTINNEGLSVSTNDSDISTTMTNSEFRVQDNAGTKLIYMGYDSVNQTSVSEMDNLTVNRYFIAGYHRVEKMEDKGRTGWFYVGD